MIVCLIPARKGSKRIKKKNILKFFGKPMIAHTIKIAQSAQIFEKIFVSTDCKETSLIAKKYGALVPFIRPKKISDNKSTDIQVLEHFLNFFKGKEKFNYLCYIYPTTPMLQVKTIQKSFKLLKIKKVKKVLTISRYEYPIQRALKMNKKGFVSFREPKYKNFVSQKLEEFYQDACQLYWYDISKIKNFNNFEKFKTIGFKLKNTDFVDLNDKNDLHKLKIYYKSLKK